MNEHNQQSLPSAKIMVGFRSIYLIDHFRRAIERNDLVLAGYYSDAMYRLMLRNNAPITVRKFMCKTCHQYLLSTRTARIRKNGIFLLFTCLNCQRIRRHAILK